MDKNKHEFGTTSLGNWDDKEVLESTELLNSEPLTEETALEKKSDSKIHEAVLEALYQAAEVDASDIQVSVNEGTVLLKGYINSRLGRRTASEVIREVEGVIEVKNAVWVKNATGLISPEDDDAYVSESTRGLINNRTGLN
jgi:hypothetical protein